jgi:hypothetical protein
LNILGINICGIIVHGEKMPRRQNFRVPVKIYKEKNSSLHKSPFSLSEKKNFVKEKIIKFRKLIQSLTAKLTLNFRPIENDG